MYMHTVPHGMAIRLDSVHLCVLVYIQSKTRVLLAISSFAEPSNTPCHMPLSPCRSSLSSAASVIAVAPSVPADGYVLPYINPAVHEFRVVFCVSPFASAVYINPPFGRRPLAVTA